MRKAWILLLPVFGLCLSIRAGTEGLFAEVEGPSIPARTQGQLGPSDVLDIVDLSFDRERNSATFVVVNKSPKTVLAFGYELTSVFSDGSTKPTRLWTDTTSSMPLAGRAGIRVAGGGHVGSIKTGDRYSQSASPTTSSSQSTRNERAVNVTVVPDFVIFADNTVVGEESRAIELFENWKILRDEYAAYLPLVRRLLQSPRFEADRMTLSNQMARARQGENVFQRPASLYSKAVVRLFYGRQALELDNVQKCITRGLNAADCVSAHVSLVEAYYAVYLAHAERAGGAK